MGCQIAIARQIRAQGADHVLRVRANHKGLHDRLEDTFALERAEDFAGNPHNYADTAELRSAAAGPRAPPIFHEDSVQSPFSAPGPPVPIHTGLDVAFSIANTQGERMYRESGDATPRSNGL